jgi:uncharacterized membrane protein YbhN (UPF0104 family)
MEDLFERKSSRGVALQRSLSPTWVKVWIAVAVVALLIYFNRVDASVLAELVHTWPWLVAAFLLMMPTFLVVSFRFRVILESQEIAISSMQAVRWTMIGSFFDLVMPSSSGGDLVKAGYVARHVGVGRRTQAVMAVAFDRVLGLIGLFLLVCIVSGMGWDLLRDLPARNMVVGVAGLASLGALLFLRVAGARSLYRVVDRSLSKHAWGQRVTQLVACFTVLREHPRHLFAALALSVLNHVFWCASLLCLVRVVGGKVEAMKGFVVFPLAIFSNVFGVAGGFGGGTVGFDLVITQLLAMENGALIGLLFQSLSALARLVGGLPFYLLAPRVEKRPE